MRNRFLYFLPGVPGCNPRMLLQRGLTSRFATAGGALMEHCIVTVPEGPDGRGCIVAQGAQTPAYRPDQQTWEQCEHFWIGVENDARPGPKDLARDIGFDGYHLKLVDGNMWKVPLLRRWIAANCTHVSALPKCLRPIPGKGIVETVNPKYAEHDAIAERIWQSFLANETVKLETLYADCTALLAMNYRAGIEEVSMLGLLDGEIGLALLSAVIDVPSIQAHSASIEDHGITSVEPVIQEEL